MERLAELGHFSPPTLDSLCEVLEYGISLRQGRVFADLWGVERLATSAANPSALMEKLRHMNLIQQPCISGGGFKETP